MVCHPCSNDDNDVDATHFCKTCDDPEPLCEMCAKEHTRHKMAKDHEICTNMAEFPTAQLNIRYFEFLQYIVCIHDTSTYKHLK